MEKKYRQSVFGFRQFNPSKRFTSFTYTELEWDEIDIGYCNEGEIIKVDGNYYIYDGVKYNDCNEERFSIISILHHLNMVRELSKKLIYNNMLN